MNQHIPRFGNMSVWKQLLLLFGFLFIGLCLTGFITEVCNTYIGVNTRPSLLMTSAVQNLLCFAAPVIVLAWLTMRQPYIGLGMCSAPGKSVVAMAGVFIIGMPALNQTIWWNEHLNLPPSMHTLQDRFMEMEAAAKAVTDTMMAGTSVGVLIVNVLLIGVLTGLCEEIFFRAGLQRILSQSMSRTAAIWVSAIVFSAMHFQFFGFVPRILLGAFFGYLYASTGSLWLNAGAHALNNTLVVVFTWLAARGVNVENFEMIGVTPSGYPLTAVVSGILVAALFIFWRKKLFFSNGKKEE